MTHQARDTRQPGYYWADNEIIDEYAAKIGPYALAVYHALCRHADKHGQSFPAIPTLAKNLKMSPRKAHDALKVLQEHGLIEIEERTKESGVRTSNCYTLIQVKKEKETEPTLHHMQGSPAPHAGSTLHHMHRKNTHIEQNPIEEEAEAANDTPPAPSQPKAIDHPYVQAYREVFQRYPAKAQIAKIAKMIVTPPGTARFTAACEAWLMRGYNVTRLDGILEWYRDGVPSYQNGKSRRRTTVPAEPYQPPTQAEIDAARSAPTLEF